MPSSGEAAPGAGGGRGAGGGLHGGAAQMLYKKRAYDEKDGPSGGGAGGSSATPSKVQRTDTSGRGHIPNVVPPKGRVATLTRISSGGQKQVRMLNICVGFCCCWKNLGLLKGINTLCFQESVFILLL